VTYIFECRVFHPTFKNFWYWIGTQSVY